MKNKFLIEYLDILVHLLKNDMPNDIYGKIDKEFWSPIGTFEEVKCVADFIRIFKGIDFNIEKELTEGWDFQSKWIKTTNYKYRLKFTIHKEFFNLNDSNKIEAKYKEYKNWLKIKEIDNDFN